MLYVTQGTKGRLITGNVVVGAHLRHLIFPIV